MEAEGLGKRRRVLTQKAELLRQARELKNERARQRAERKVQSSETEAQMDALSSLFQRVSVDTTEEDLVATFTSMGMGGRRRRTKKHVKKSRRKTNR